MHSLPLALRDGLLFSQIDGKRVVVDTGAPRSIGLGCLRLGDHEFPLTENFLGTSLSSLQEHIPGGLDVLVGADILGQFEVGLDLSRGVLELRPWSDEPPVDAIALSSYMGIPVVEVKVAHRLVLLFLDTGASLSYLPPEFTSGLVAGARVEDFYPGFGRFETPTFEIGLEVESEVNTYFIETRVGHLPELLGALLTMGGAQGILGNDFFGRFRLTLNLKGSWLSLEPLDASSEGPENRVGATPHDSWAQWYDLVQRQSFGPFVDELTALTLQVFEGMLPSSGAVLDLGAGTGRLSIPLAARGHQVHAVEPSAAMLEQLKDAARTKGLSIATTNATMQSLESDGTYDLAFAVFTVMNYLVREEDLRALARTLVRVLRPGGHFLFDLASEHLFDDSIYETEAMRREVVIEELAGDVFRYTEHCSGQLDDQSFEYTDEFLIRSWEPEQVLQILSEEGLILVDDLTEVFLGSVSHYLLVARPA